jgi:hypothetical protein
MTRSRNEYEPQLHGRVSAKGVWGNEGEVDLSDLFSTPALFKFSLGDLDRASTNAIPLSVFNMQFYSMKTIASDSYTAKNQLQNFLEGAEKPSEGSGWVYMYTFLPELAYGLSTTTLGEEEIASVYARIKIGMTTVSPLERIEVQLDTSSPHTAIILGLFWTPDIKRADKTMRTRLEGFRPIEAVGSEWYLGRPEELLVEVLTALTPSRTPRRVIPSPTIA